jgi:Immunoglobulin-like domain of bacterial spore germination/LysM domain
MDFCPVGTVEFRLQARVNRFIEKLYKYNHIPQILQTKGEIMPKFHKMRSLLFMLIFVAALMSWLVQQPLFAAGRQQTTATDTAVTYVVQAGDTLSSIARRFETTVAALIGLNNLPNADVIYVGQTLFIRAAEEATPTPGSTVPEATPTATATATLAATATAVTTPTLTATPEATATITTTPIVTATAVWTDPELPIEVFSPVGNGLYHSPIEVIGFSQTFEGNVNLRLSDDAGNVLAERNTTGGSVDGFAFFHSYLRFTATEPITGLLEIFESSAQDGSEINKVSIPMTLLPGQRVIDINNLTLGKTVCSPIIVAGYSNTFEATLLVDLSDRTGDMITQTNTMGGNLGIYADFLTALASNGEEAQPLLVGAYEEAASGAGAVDRTRFPVTLYPAGSTECP